MDIPGTYTADIPGTHTVNMPGTYPADIPGTYAAGIPGAYAVDIPGTNMLQRYLGPMQRGTAAFSGGQWAHTAKSFTTLML